MGLVAEQPHSYPICGNLSVSDPRSSGLSVFTSCHFTTCISLPLCLAPYHPLPCSLAA